MGVKGNRKAGFYSNLYSLIDEVNSSPQKTACMRDDVRDFSEVLRGICLKKDSSVRVEIVGSARPDRFLVPYDPKDSRGTFPSDIDAYVITKENLSKEVVRELNEDFDVLFKGRGLVSEHRGVPTITSRYRNFPVDIGFVSASQAESQIPLLVARNALQLDARQTRHIRALSVLLKRYGLYGGYNDAVSGLAAEKIVLQTGSFYKSVEFLAQRANKRETVSHPITGKDLLGSLAPDIERRLPWCMADIARTKKIWPQNFSYHVWWHHHQANYRSGYRLPIIPGIEGKGPRNIISSSKTFLARTAEAMGWQLCNASVFVMPDKDGYDLYFAYNDVERKVTDMDRSISGVGRRIESYVGVKPNGRGLEVSQGELMENVRREYEKQMNSLLTCLSERH